MPPVPSVKNGLNRMLLVPLVIVSLLTPACLPKASGVNQVQPEYYPACFQPFLDLEQARTELIKRTLIGAGLGMVGGAAVGALASGDVKGAVIGGVSGMLAGGVFGYGIGKMSQIKDDRERMRSYQADMNADMRNASRVEQYAMASMQCYTREFKTLLASYKKGLIGKAEVESRYAEIRRGLTYISGILADSRSELTKRDKEYREAFEAEAREKNKKPRAVAGVESKRAKASVKKSSTKKTSVKKRGNELDRLNAELGERRRSAEKRTLSIEKMEAVQSAAAEKNKGTSNVDAVAQYYEERYLDSIVRLEEAEDANQRALAVISNAARYAGIDTV